TSSRALTPGKILVIFFISRIVSDMRHSTPYI
ncbi:MAG: hypothetical protein ACJAX4_002661, partial [Clostridium sp.]